MMHSQPNTKRIEQYILGKLNPVDKLLFEVELAISSGLKEEVHYQQKVYRLTKIYHRQKLKEELEKVHLKLFTDPAKLSFKRRIQQLFN